MNAWSAYETRMNAYGKDLRDASLKRERYLISKKLNNNLSYQTAIVNGVRQDIAVVSSDNLNEKTIFSGYSDTSPVVHGGSLIEWMKNYWLIVERDADETVYSKSKMSQCNFLIKWVDQIGNVHEQWCVVEDGTKYLVGEYEDRDFVTTRGDTRLVLIISKNNETAQLNRKTRFLIDDPDTDRKLAYQLTKPLKVGTVFQNEGIYKFVLQECASTDDDNHELGIADYYKYHERTSSSSSDYNSVVETGKTTIDGRQVWL